VIGSIICGLDTNPMLTIDMINAARDRIASRIHRTPVVTSRLFNDVAGKQVFFKCENLQRAGAFKIRGATNKIQSLTEEEKRRGIVAFSSGNHAQAGCPGWKRSRCACGCGDA
jgi:threonine dehydratase